MQIAALELRVAAYRLLEYPEAMQLLGVQPSERRLELYATCRPLLSSCQPKLLGCQQRHDQRGDDEPRAI